VFYQKNRSQYCRIAHLCQDPVSVPTCRNEGNLPDPTPVLFGNIHGTIPFLRSRGNWSFGCVVPLPENISNSDSASVNYRVFSFTGAGRNPRCQGVSYSTPYIGSITSDFHFSSSRPLSAAGKNACISQRSIIIKNKIPIMVCLVAGYTP